MLPGRETLTLHHLFPAFFCWTATPRFTVLLHCLLHPFSNQLPSPNRRAQRSLARNAIRNNNWAAAAQHWEAALALNPLNPEGWFSLGFAYIKEKDYPKALQVRAAAALCHVVATIKHSFDASVKEKKN